MGKAIKRGARAHARFVLMDKVLLQHSHAHLLSMSVLTAVFQHNSGVVTELRGSDRPLYDLYIRWLVAGSFYILLFPEKLFRPPVPD